MIKLLGNKQERALFLVFCCGIFALFSNLQQHQKITTPPSSPWEASTIVAPCSGMQLGQNGTWVQDWEFAKQYGQYPDEQTVFSLGGPLQKSLLKKFRPSAQSPVPWHTSWRWVDFNRHNCQIDYAMNAERVCTLFHRLDVRRVFFFGDSLGLLQYKSFLNKMGKRNVVNKTSVELSSAERLTYATLLCKDYNLTSIPFLFARDGGGNPGKNSKDVFNVTFAQQARDFLGAGGTNLVLLNIGAHYHSVHDYQTALGTLFGWFDDFQRPNDVIFFRTTPSGHKDCEPRDRKQADWETGIQVRPYERYSDFVPTTLYDWNLFDDYNRYTRQQLWERRQRAGATFAHIRLLDVVNMTILRRDGHIGGKDCLHYFAPGPVDWWNHLFYTELQELAASRSKQTLLPVVARH